MIRFPESEMETKFTFFVYEFKDPWRDQVYLHHGLRAEGFDGDRFERYFLAFWFAAERLSDMDAFLDELAEVESGVRTEATLGHGPWDIFARRDHVEFVSTVFDEWNDGVNNIFPFHQFKPVALAWRKHLSVPPTSKGDVFSINVDSQPAQGRKA